jgi:predicted transcriptional regulator
MAEQDIIDLPLGTKEIADTLKISESVVRKYALALEKAGYEFDKSGTARLFKHHDVETFRMINKLTENSKLNVEHAVGMVMTHNTRTTSSVAGENSVISTSQQNNMQHDNAIIAVGNQLKMQQDLIHSLVEAMAMQSAESDKRHNELMDKIDKQTEINNDLNDKLLLAVDLIQKLDSKVDKIEENEKKGFFKRLFG